MSNLLLFLPPIRYTYSPAIGWETSSASLNGTDLRQFMNEIYGIVDEIKTKQQLMGRQAYL